VREQLLAIADDELFLGWRESEWTGIAPMLEEDVAFSSIAQNEIGHARALYQLVVGEDGDADALAFDRPLEEYRCAPFVELHLLDWAHTIARRWLYEVADKLRLEDLALWVPDVTPQLEGLVAKINREEAYHRMHAWMWAERLKDEARFRDAVTELLPYALGVLDNSLQPALLQELDPIIQLEWVEPVERGTHTDALAPMWEEMTMVRRSAPAGAQW